MSDLAELIAHLRKDADFVDRDAYDGCWEVKETDRGKRLRQAATALAALVAERDAQAAEVAKLREVASNADRAMRFVKLVASQRLSGAAIRWYEDEFGDDGEPDFIGAYDSFIQQARCIVDDTERARALAQGGEP